MIQAIRGIIGIAMIELSGVEIYRNAHQSSTFSWPLELLAIAGSVVGYILIARNYS